VGASRRLDDSPWSVTPGDPPRRGGARRSARRQHAALSQFSHTQHADFDDTHASCLYAEYGFSFARIGQPPADVLVSLSCDQVQAQNFIWPHKSVGLTPDTAARISKLVPSIFGG
jgi:hypothetical protein